MFELLTRWLTLIQDVSHSVWPDQNYWWEWLNMHTELECELLSSMSRSEPMIRIIEHAPSLWAASYSSSWWVTSTDENGWTCIQRQVSQFHVWVDENHWWTPIQRVSCSPVLEQMRIISNYGLTPVQFVSCPPVFEQIRAANGNYSTCVQRVSGSQAFGQIRTTDKNC